MTTTRMSSTVGQRATLSDPAYQAFLLLRTVFSIAPILFGLDKFANLLVGWPSYLASWIDQIVPDTAQQAMYAVGVIVCGRGDRGGGRNRCSGGTAARSLASRRLARHNYRQSADIPRFLRHRTTRFRAVRRRGRTGATGHTLCVRTAHVRHHVTRPDLTSRHGTNRRLSRNDIRTMVDTLGGLRDASAPRRPSRQSGRLTQAWRHLSYDHQHELYWP